MPEPTACCGAPVPLRVSSRRCGSEGPDLRSVVVREVSEHVGDEVDRVALGTEAHLPAVADLADDQVRDGQTGHEVEVRCLGDRLAGRTDGQEPVRRRLVDGDVEHDRADIRRDTAVAGDLQVDALAASDRAGPRTDTAARVEQSARFERMQLIAAGREVAEHVDDAVGLADAVVHVDLAVSADAHHDEVRGGPTGNRVEVRRLGPRGPTGADGQERGFRHVDGRHVGDHGRRSRQGDAPSTGDRDGQPFRRSHPADLDTTGTVARVDDPGRGDRDEESGRRRDAAAPADRCRRRALPGRQREQPEVLVHAAEDRGRAAAEPAVHDAGVVRAEVDGVGDAIPPVEARQVRVLTVRSTLDVGAEHERAVRRAVIGAVAVVLERGAAELGERHHRHPVRPPRVEREEEPFDRRVELHHPVGVHRGLVGVAVEIAPAGFEHAETEIGVDQPGGDLEPADESV